MIHGRLKSQQKNKSFSDIAHETFFKCVQQTKSVFCWQYFFGIDHYQLNCLLQKMIWHTQRFCIFTITLQIFKLLLLYNGFLKRCYQSSRISLQITNCKVENYLSIFHELFRIMIFLFCLLVLH